VLDLQFIGKDDSHLVVCTNSEHLKVYDVETWSCQILHGHTDIVLSIAVHKKTNTIASSSKVWFKIVFMHVQYNPVKGIQAVRIDFFFILKVANILCFILIAVEFFHNIIRK
jgi:hypothetical protein